MEAVLVKWSPAQELLEMAQGMDPELPENALDVEYLSHLVHSYQRMSELEGYKDLMRRLAAEENKISNKWKSGESVTPQEQGAVKAFHFLRKLPAFAENRYKSVAGQLAKKASKKGVRE